MIGLFNDPCDSNRGQRFLDFESRSYRFAFDFWVQTPLWAPEGSTWGQKRTHRKATVRDARSSETGLLGDFLHWPNLSRKLNMLNTCAKEERNRPTYLLTDRQSTYLRGKKETLNFINDSNCRHELAYPRAYTRNKCTYNLLDVYTLTGIGLLH